MFKAGHRVFVVVAPRLRSLTSVLVNAFTHPWVASYQIGFGPPLIRSSDRLLSRLKEARSGLDKLTTYLEVCVFDPTERARLATIHRRLLVRRHGPLEAEVLAAASADVIDLSFRLHPPLQAPDSVREEMLRAGIQLNWIDPGLAPEDHSARFMIHLFDPSNDRLLHADVVAEAAKGHYEPLAVELRVPVVLSDLWSVFCADYEGRTGYRVIDLKEPGSRARVIRDGARR